MSRLALPLLLLAAACERASQAPPPPSTHLVLSSAWATVAPGDTTRLRATTLDPQGETLAVATTWASADPGVATVDSGGLVRGRSQGVVTIEATEGFLTGRVTVAVEPAVLLGAGDIASCASDGDEATAALLDTLPGVVFTAGDNAYPGGSASDYSGCYNPSWGRHKPRTRPAPGNHEYHTAGAAAYYGYFGALAGDSGKGYYSYTVGTWHIISLNSNSLMAPGSHQEQWLGADLAAHPARCTLAYWHHPRFSSGEHGPTTEMSDIWQLLYDRGAEVVLSGHDHEYERFAPQDGLGNPDAARGVRQFVVGTGGGELRQIVARARNSEFVRTSTYGVIRLELYSDRYAWS